MHALNEDGTDMAARDLRYETHPESAPLSPRNEGEQSMDPVEFFDGNGFSQVHNSRRLTNASTEDPLDDRRQGSTYGYHLETSSSSSQHSGATFGEDDEYGAEGDQYRRNGSSSSRSSISSLPGSVVVHPPGKVNGLPFVDQQNGSSNRPTNGAGGRKKGRFPKYGPRMRDRSSPFRHPSSVVAMQMGDEVWDESEGGFDTLTPSSKKGWQQERPFTQSPSFSERSTGSRRSGNHSGSPRFHRHNHSSPRTASPGIQQQKEQHPEEQAPKEYPLVLLHCTLLPPSLSLPQGLGTPSPQLLKEVIPLQYWQRWKLLEDKVVGSGLLRDRGVLISHPQEAYDLLEERLLESLELVRPRVAYGHFLGSEDHPDGGEDNYHTQGDSRSVHDDSDEHTCPDCGRPVESNERKWDVKVYAANGLMRAGAWAAAWREMEKVDVEVSVWLPTEVKQDLERRIGEKDAINADVERRMTDEEKRRWEVYGDLSGMSQEDIGGLEDEKYGHPHENDKSQDTEHSVHNAPPEQRQDESPSREIDLRIALSNYFRILANDPRNAALFFMALLVLFFAMNSASPVTPASLTTRGTESLQSSSSPPLEQYLSSTVQSTVPVHTALSSDLPANPHSSSSSLAPFLSVAAHESAGAELPLNPNSETPEVSLPGHSTLSSRDVFESFSNTAAADDDNAISTDVAILRAVAESEQPPGPSEEEV